MNDPLLQHLVARGLVNESQVEEILLRHRERGGALDTGVLESGGLSEALLLQALAEVSGVPSIQLSDFEPNPEVGSLLPPKISERLGTIPLSLEGIKLHVACAYPIQENDLRQIGFLLNKKLELWIALEVRIRDWISVLYNKPLDERFASVLRRIDPTRANANRKMATAAPAPEPLVRLQVASARVAVEGRTLEESLSREAYEELAKNVAVEPIPLQVRKSSARKEARVDIAVADESSGEKEKPRNGNNGTHPLALGYIPDLSHQNGKAVDFPAVEPSATVAPTPPPAEPTPQWSLSQARTALGGVTLDRDGIIDVALTYASQTFDFAAAFAMLRGNALAWGARGEDAESFNTAKVLIPLDSASVFRTVTMTRGSYMGPTPADALTKHFLELFGRSPRSVFVYPVVVKSRVAAILYGDCGQKPMSQRRVSDYLLFCQDLPAAFENLILFKKQRFGMDQVTTLDIGWNQAASVWSPAVSETQAGRGRSATLELPSTSQAERPPPDYAPLLKRLVGPDAAARSRALTDFARSPEASARFLAANFPGPTAWARVPLVELPEPSELGPVPGAIARLGRPGAIALAPLLDTADLDTRYFAILTAGSLPYAEVVDGVLRALFDVEPDISSAARATAAALRSLPRLDASMKDLRQELAARDPLRRSLAARALGVLHDREAVDGLIGLTGSDDQMCAESAAGALREITKASFGTRPRQWSAWWAENRDRRRVEWLIAGLRHKELDLRLAAIEELSRCINDNLGYFADGPEREREAAIGRWLTSLPHSERFQGLE